MVKSKDTHIPPGYKKTKVGVIPEDWEVSTLGNVADVYSGSTPNTQIEVYWNGAIPWCTPSDITKTTTKYLKDNY